VENPASEPDGSEPDERKPNGAGNEDIAKESQLGVLECAGGGDDRSEWKRRWRQAGNGQGDGRTLAHFFLEVVEAFAAHQFLETFLATFAAHQIQHQDIEGEISAMSGDENNEEEIVTEGQEEKRGIQDTKDDQSESTDMKKKREQGAEEGLHA
jgi:hypothetical protein